MGDDAGRDIGDISLLAENSSPEDAGAETQSRFRYQHECTVRSCIPLLLAKQVTAVVCEEHEDFVVFYEDALPELVSVKHREVSQGPWTFASLCSNGGVLHLFDRWQGIGGKATCRVMTNAGLSTGTDGAQAFATACHERDDETLGPWIEQLGPRLGVPDDEESVKEFAKSLSIEPGLPAKEHIAATNLRDLVVPALEELGLAPGSAQACYERLLDMIAKANRDAIGDPVNLIDYVADPHRFDAAVATNRRLQRRLIDRDKVRSALTPDDPGEVQLTPNDPVRRPPPPSRLRQKLDRGGLGPTGVNTAIRLRASWYAYEAAHRMSIPGGDPALEDLRLRVQELVAACEARADRGQPYAGPMYLDVRESVTTSALDKTFPFPLDDKLLQGLVFQLTDECLVWWSEQFDLDGS
ncbi:MAG TPA: dsDNA nuclease domain-containing protein [Solirubrobacterales bacterium]|nr:dsDNA nuclease domain-containing protein [Solirubrobacterales bacterium]